MILIAEYTTAESEQRLLNSKKTSCFPLPHSSFILCNTSMLKNFCMCAIIFILNLELCSSCGIASFGLVRVLKTFARISFWQISFSYQASVVCISLYVHAGKVCVREPFLEGIRKCVSATNI